MRAAYLRDEARARKEGCLVHRGVKHRRIVPKDVLRAVAVVHVPVNNGDALRSAQARLICRDGGVVEKAKAHRPVARGVMPGWAYERESKVRRTRHEFVDHRHRAARTKVGRFDGTGGHERIGVEVSLAPAPRFKPREMLLGVRSQEGLERRCHGRHV